ncbi:MAG: ABC transporter substrate-binding protein [Anaerolineales bacterium]|nr:ABC transporter substrate-binding protein [Anaerolineales bacterium]
MLRKEWLWKLTTLLVVASMLLLAGCAPSTPTEESAPAEVEDTTGETTTEDEAASAEESEMDVVKVAYVPVMHFAAAYAAESNGYFENLNLDVQFERVTSGTEAVAFLSEGQVDVGAIAVVASTWNAFSEGLDLRIVAPAALKLMSGDPTMLVVRKELYDSGEVTSAADLVGRRVAAAGGPGSGGEYLVAKALESAGLTIFDVELENLGNADMPAAMEAGQIDAALTGSPYVTTMLEAGTAVPLVEDMVPGSMTVVFVYSGQFMSERPDVAQRFMEGLMMGARAMQGENYLSDTNIEGYLSCVNSDEETLRNTPPMLYDPNLGVRLDSLEDVESVHMANGRLEYDTPLDLSTIVDLSWQEAALEKLGRWMPEALDPAELIRVAYVPVMHFASAYAAEGNGYFDALGLDVEFEKVSSGTEAVAFLSEGQVDVGAIAVVASTWSAFAQGLDLRIVAPAALKLMEGDPTMLVVRTDLFDSGEVTSGADLAGLRIAVAGGPGSGGEYLVAKALEPFGLTIFDVELENIGNPDMPAAIEAGQIDAALTGSPYVTTMLEAGTAVPLVQDMVPGSMTVVFVYSAQFMEERPEAARRFMLGLMQGTRAMQGDDYLNDTNIAAYLGYVSSEEDTIRNTPAMLYDPDLVVRTESLEDVQRVHMTNGRFDYETPVDINTIVDLSWQQYALMILGGYEE